MTAMLYGLYFLVFSVLMLWISGSFFATLPGWLLVILVMVQAALAGSMIIAGWWNR